MLVLWISFAIAVLDQVTKHLVQERVPLGRANAVLDGLFNITYVQNTGAAWGLFSRFTGGLAIFSALMLFAILVFRRFLFGYDRISRIAAGCILGGITGNLIDRLRLGYVVDFLDFHWRHHHFPSFNVADAAICTGVGLYLIAQWRVDRHAKARKRALAEPAPPAPADAAM